MFRDISISAVANGWVVKVGCQSFVFTSIDQLVADLKAYLRDPITTEKRMLDEACNIKFTLNRLNQGDATGPTASGGNYNPSLNDIQRALRTETLSPSRT